jgi:KaiC/GvpD/RAD55 family RecA-like ATPase
LTRGAGVGPQVVRRPDQDVTPSERSQGKPGTIDSLLNPVVGAVLIKGLPGTGKTSLAVEMLRRAGGGFYFSTRVSREKLSQQVPGIKEMLVTGETNLERDGSVVNVKDLRLAAPSQLLQLLVTSVERGGKKGPLIVLDSWDAMAKEMPAVERLKTEKVLLAMTEGDRAKLVFISEEPENTTLGYLVDAIVELRRELHEGAAIRTLEVFKLRGGPILRPKTLFTLAGSRFTEFAESTGRAPKLAGGKFEPIKHSEQFYSSGIGALDEGFSGGFKRGSITLLEFGADLNPTSHAGIYNIIFSNFILNGGCAFTAPTGGANPKEIVDLARLTVPPPLLSDGFAVGTFERSAEPCTFFLDTTSIEACFNSLWKEMAALKGPKDRSLGGMIGIDELESLFEPRELLFYLSRTIQIVRKNQDCVALKVGNSSSLKNKLADLSDTYAKWEVVNDTQTIHGIKPPGPIIQISYEYSRGYPYPVFTPVL